MQDHANGGSAGWVFNIQRFPVFVRELDTVREIRLLPYHRFGQGKYERLGMEYPMATSLP